MRKMIPVLISADEDIEGHRDCHGRRFCPNKIPQLRPDVITLDIDMPRMDGLTALKSIVKGFQETLLYCQFTDQRKGQR